MPDLSRAVASGPMTDGAHPEPSQPNGPSWEALAVNEQLRDGSPVHLRPIRPDDGTALVAFHEDLSSRAVYRRFFFTHPHLSPAEVERFTHVDYVDRVAFVAEIDDRLVAVGRYERVPDTAEAEVAFVVADEHQHRGFGTLLLEHLADVAWGHGITEFVAQTMADNRDMVGVFLASGFPVAVSSEQGTVSARLSIAPGDDYRRAREARRSEARDAPRRGTSD